MEKQIRLGLPSTSDVECEIIEGPDQFILTFYQNGTQIKSSYTVPHKRLTSDRLVDVLTETGITFFSFSAIFDVAELLLNTIKENFQELSIDGPKVIPPQKEKVDDLTAKFGIIIDDSIDEEDQIIEDVKEGISETPVDEEIIIPASDRLLTKFEMPYSQSGYASIYSTKKGAFAVVFSKGEELVARKTFTQAKINQDALVDVISDSGIDFLSFSAIYESAEKIESIIMNPEQFEKTPTSDLHVDGGIADVDAITDLAEVVTETTPAEEEVTLIDLSDFDTSEFSSAEDFDKFIAKVKENVEVGQPLPITEMEIPNSGGMDCIILRKFDTWYLQFRASSGSLSNIISIPRDQDEIARVINNEIPQISFSYLYDASELILKSIEKLAVRPMNEIIMNVAVNYFVDIIDKNEATGDLKTASKISGVLLKRFRKEKNPKGILQFGKKLVKFYETQGKHSKIVKLQSSLVSELLGIDLDTAVDFTLESVDLLAEMDKHLNAANLCDLVLDHYLSSEETLTTLSTILSVGKKQIDYYKKARLPVILWENAIRYAHFSLKQLPLLEDITDEQRSSYIEDIGFLIDSALAVQEEKKASFEILSTLEESSTLLKGIEEKELYQKYIGQLILTLETQGKKEETLKAILEASEYLMDAENYVKACEFGNQAIKLFYELNKIPQAVEFSLGMVRGLIDINESDAARNYLKFVEDLIAKAYKDDESQRIEKQLALGDLLGKLGMKDKSKSFIQTALQTIEDPKKREKIILQYVDDLLASQAALTAQEMVNLELARLLETKKVKDVVKFCYQFIDKLKKSENGDMIFDYVKYSSNLMIQTDYTDYNPIIDSIKDFVQLEDINKASAIIDQLIILQTKNEDYTRAIDSLTRFIESLLKNPDRIDLIQKYVFELTEVYRKMGDEEGAIEKLVNYQKNSFDVSIDLSQMFTDLIVYEIKRTDIKKKDKTFNRIISSLTLFIDNLLESTDRYDLIQKYVFEIAETYRKVGDGDGALEKLVKYQEDLLDHSVELSQKITDMILKEFEQAEKYKQSIEIVSKIIDKQLEQGKFQDAYIFSVQNARYIESSGDITDVIKYLDTMRDRFLEYDQFEDATKMTDLVFRFAKTHQQYKIAIQSLKTYSKSALEREDYAVAIKFALNVANLFEEENKQDKALEFLQMVLNVTYEHEKEASLNIFRKMIEIHKNKDDFKKITKKVVDPLLMKYSDVDLLNVFKEVVSPQPDEFLTYSQKFYDRLIQESTLTSEAAEGIVSLVNSTYEGGLTDTGDGLMEKYIKKVLSSGFPEKSMQLLSIFSEKTEKPFSEVIVVSLDFTQDLINMSRVEMAREFVDRMTQQIGSDPKLVAEKNQLRALINQKFAFMVAIDNPDIASEYAYIASEFLRSANEFDGIVKIYEDLASKYTTPKRVIRIYKRGIYICEKFKAKKHEVSLFTSLIKYLLSISDDSALHTFQTAIEKLEEMEDLDELFNNVREILEAAIKTDKIDLAYKYLEYVTKLAMMINKGDDLGAIQVFMLNYFGDLKDTDKAEIVRSYIEQLNIKPRKFKKEFNLLEDERKRYIQITPVTEEVTPDLAAPTLVDAASIVGPGTETIPEEPPVIEREKDEEEVLVEVIEEFGTEVQEPLPDLSSLQVGKVEPVSEPPSEIEREVSVSKVDEAPGEVLEIPIKEKGEEAPTILSDDELTSLFSKEPTPSEPSSETFPPTEEIIPETKPVVKEGITLSDDEITTLFRKKPDMETVVKEAPEIDITSSTTEDEWEVDSFGRLIKKDSIPEAPITEAKPPIPEKAGTPDISSLEAQFEEPDAGAMKPTLLKDLQVEPDLDSVSKKQLMDLPDIASLEEALVDTETIISKDELKREEPKLFDQEITSPITSIVDSIAEDEVTESTDIFGVPEVSYEEITPPEEPSKSDIKPPDLIDLFSDALSELGSIGGESGEGTKDKKKKK